MKVSIHRVVLLSLLVTAGCDSSPGPDAISSHRGVAGAAIADCARCHASANDPSLDPLVTNGDGTNGKHLKHVTSLGYSCDRCHLNYSNSSTHFNGTMDTGNPAVNLVFFDSVNPAGEWTNDSGANTGACSSLACHGSDTPDWYGTGWTRPACATCHNAPVVARRQIVGTGGDFALNTAAINSRHVAGANDPESNQCEVCHEMSTHGEGTVRVKNADDGAGIVYNTAAANSLEPFCLSCHDADGAANTFVTGGAANRPFNDGRTMGITPNRASSEIQSQWSKNYGHKQKGLTCLGTGAANTGCHANGHGSAFVGLLARNLTLPTTLAAQGVPYQIDDEGAYELCFNCHASYPRVTKEAILGVKAGSNYDWDHWWFDYTQPDWWNWPYPRPYYISSIMTKFRDRLSFWWDSYLNLHYWHLQDGGDNGWRYRDSIASNIHCLTCHNVHGSNTQWGWVYDEMQFTHDINEERGTINLVDLNDLDNYPISCAYNCHPMGGPADSWFEPSGECEGLPCASCNNTGCIP